MGFTANQWAIVALVLVLGWLLGLASRSGSSKWRRAYREEVAARETADTRLASANARIAELERVSSTVPTPTVLASTTPVGHRDNLALIRGVGQSGETALNEAGLYRYGQIEHLSPQDADHLETKLGLSRGQIDADEWREQAQLLHANRLDEHRSRYA